MSLKRRLNDLEEKRARSGDPVIARQFGDGPIVVGGEEMTEGEFENRYPEDVRIVVRFEEHTPGPDKL